MRKPTPDQYKPVPCPCCKRAVDVPDLEVIIQHYKLTPRQAAILRTVWEGKGQPVPTERIFTAMYAHDRNGGPRYEAMYKSLKEGMCRLRVALEGSGVGIETAGYRAGYRIVFGEPANV